MYFCVTNSYGNTYDDGVERLFRSDIKRKKNHRMPSFRCETAEVQCGDTIEISQNDDPSRAVPVAIKALYRYASFADLFEDFPLTRFGGDSKESLLQEISAYYSEDDQRKNGIVGIGIEVLK